MPVFSILVPYYNTEPEYYAKTFACLKQLPEEVAEILVVDDGSEIAAYQSLRDYLKRELPSAKLFRKGNGGQNSARQFGIDWAIGSYVLFLDSDDYLDCGVLLKLADYLGEHKPDVVAFNFDTVTPEAELLDTCDVWEDGFNEISLQRLSLASDSLCRQCYCLQRLKELPFGLVQDVRIGEDLASSLSINLSLRDCVSFGGVLYHYVKRPTSIIHNTPKEAAYDVLFAFDEVIRRCGPDFSGCYSEVEWMATLHCVGWNSLRLLRCGIDTMEGKCQTFRWMQERFPGWERNPYTEKVPVGKEIWFRLSTAGYWRILCCCVRLWDGVKAIVSKGEKR